MQRLAPLLRASARGLRHAARPLPRAAGALLSPGARVQWTAGPETARRHASGQRKEIPLSEELLVPHYHSFLKLLAASALGGFVLAYLADTRAGLNEYVVMPLIHAALDPEEAHKLAVWMASKGLSPVERHPVDDASLEVKLFGKTFRNPVGLAAGFDKNAEAVDALFDMGFGFVEVGSVLPKPQPGNPKPRVFRLKPDGAVINRYGLNSEGVAAVEQRLRDRLHTYLRRHPDVRPAESPSSVEDEMRVVPAHRSLREDRFLGINVGRNKDSPQDSNEDFVAGLNVLGPYADYVVVNVSCPNQAGISAMQRKGVMEGLLKEVVAARDANLPHRPPVLAKLSPDLHGDELEDAARAVLDAKVDGVIISNTTNQRPESLKTPSYVTSEWGGLSGPPLKPLSLSTIRRFRDLTGGTIPIIGCGGITSGADALEYARAGASLVQLYTGMAMGGPGVVTRVKEEVRDALKKEGKTWTEVVGTGV